MKKTHKFNQLISLILLIGIMGIYSGCSGEDETPEPTAQEVATANLTSGPWRLNTVTVDGNNQTSVYEGLTLSFTPNGYSTTNGGIVWPASGTWTFQNEAATMIKRSDDVDITIQELTLERMRLSFFWDTTTFKSGRSFSIEGQHVFTFTK